MLNRFISTIFSVLPDPKPVRPPGLEALDNLVRIIKLIALCVIIISLIICAVLFAIKRYRGEVNQISSKITFSLTTIAGTCTIILFVISVFWM